MRSHKRSDKSGEYGATLVEFALMAVLGISLLGVFIDVSVGLSDYNTLTSLTDDMTRYIGVSRDTCSFTCPGNDLRTFIEENNRLLKRYDALVADGASFSGTLVNAGERLRVDATMPLNCFFCSLLSDSVQFSTTSESRLEKRTCFSAC